MNVKQVAKVPAISFVSLQDREKDLFLQCAMNCFGTIYVASIEIHKKYIKNNNEEAVLVHSAWAILNKMLRNMWVSLNGCN